MTTAWSWSLMREPQLRSTTLAATPQVRRVVALNGAELDPALSPAEGWMQSPKNLYGDSRNQQLLGFSIDIGKVDARGVSWSREGLPITCAGIKMGILYY